MLSSDLPVASEIGRLILCVSLSHCLIMFDDHVWSHEQEPLTIDDYSKRNMFQDFDGSESSSLFALANAAIHTSSCQHEIHCATWTATSMQSPQVGCGVQTNPLLSAGLWAGGRNQMNKARRGHLRIWEFDSKTSWLQHFNMFLYVFVSILQHISTWQFLWPLSIWSQVEVQLLLRILAQVQLDAVGTCWNYFFLDFSFARISIVTCNILRHVPPTSRTQGILVTIWFCSPTLRLGDSTAEPSNLMVCFAYSKSESQWAQDLQHDLGACQGCCQVIMIIMFGSHSPCNFWQVAGSIIAFAAFGTLGMWREPLDFYILGCLWDDPKRVSGSITTHIYSLSILT